MRLVEKFNQMPQNKKQFVNPQSVKNISNRNLDQHEISVLSKGLNFASNHSPKDVLQFIAHIEPAVEDLKNVNN